MEEINLAAKKLLFDGKIKKIFETDDKDKLIQEFKDDVGGLKGLTKHKIKNKGLINNEISSHIFEYLQSHHIGTYFISNLGDREMLIKRLKMIPFDIIIRNITSDEFSQKYGIEEGMELETPVIEYYLKNDKLDNPLLTESHITALKLITLEEFISIGRNIIKINAIMKSFFERRNIKLIDFKLEFGIDKDHIILANELIPDNCHLWDIDAHNKFNKERFRFDNNNAAEAYQEIYKRVVGDKK
jgi:phosphoribosylaminoimidazole-succinocarboxamide synthase